MTCDEARDLAPLLALDVLDVDERDVLDDHLASCEACHDEASAHAEVAAALALTVPQVDPSAGLRRRVLASASATRQRSAAGTHGRPVAIRGSGRLGRWRVSMTSLVAALALLVAVGSSLWALSLRAELDEQNARIATLTQRANNYTRVAAVLQAADTQVRVLRGTGDAPQAFGRVYIDPETSEGMLMVRNLPPLPTGYSYQLWVTGADGVRQSAGILTWTDRQGNGYTLIKCPETLARWQSFGVTLEPAGGSTGPTGRSLLGGTI